MSDRVENETIHGKYLASHGAEKLWNWESPAGIVRWQRRTAMLSANLTSSMKVLEIGCGTGLFTKELLKTKAEIFAIDLSQDLLRTAMATITESNVHFEEQNACCLRFKDEMFDAVVGSSTLHHIDLIPALQEFNRVLKPGGFITFTEPNMLNPQVFVERKFRFLFEYVSPDEYAFIKGSLTRDLRKTGFENINILPFDWLHPSTPKKLIRLVDRLGSFTEKIPVIKHFAGSLYIHAKKSS